ncbi:MAG TPA: class I SAM-dependent methyltransferase [Bryobacteraceae bacterium]|jgi:SAM-dependent methyltransferase|nr:class I SAM-dependent methyltransferase [Bryobacteraceae bacterium]
MSVYDFPEYYRIAFSFRDIPHELNFLEQVIRTYSQIPVRHVLELASGTSPYLEELIRRGYSYTGLDINASMLRFARREARQKGIDAEFIRGDLRRFDFGRRTFDLVYVLLGSLYVGSNAELLKHLDCVARCLRRGGLYVLDGVVQFKLLGDAKQSWTVRQRGVTVKTTYNPQVVDPFEQSFYENLKLEISDHGKRRIIESRSLRKVLFPQELLLLLQVHGEFEYVGAFRNFSMKPSREAKGRHIVVIRRRRSQESKRRTSSN